MTLSAGFNVVSELRICRVKLLNQNLLHITGFFFGKVRRKNLVIKILPSVFLYRSPESDLSLVTVSTMPPSSIWFFRGDTDIPLFVELIRMNVYRISAVFDDHKITSFHIIFKHFNLAR